jgi:hypothetical protein
MDNSASDRLDPIETRIDYKMNREVSQTRLRPHPYEFAMYFDA